MLKFWERNVTDFHANNLNNPPIPENVDNKDGDNELLTINSNSLSNSRYFDGKQDIKWASKCAKEKLSETESNLQNNRTNWAIVIID